MFLLDIIIPIVFELTTEKLLESCLENIYCRKTDYQPVNVGGACELYGRVTIKAEPVSTRTPISYGRKWKQESKGNEDEEKRHDLI